MCLDKEIAQVAGIGGLLDWNSSSNESTRLDQNGLHNGTICVTRFSLSSVNAEQSLSEPGSWVLLELRQGSSCPPIEADTASQRCPPSGHTHGHTVSESALRITMLFPAGLSVGQP